MATRTDKSTAGQDSSTYEVGFGKPPKATQFRKGESGNPKGRPKGKRNLATELHLALDETVVVTENGKRTKLTKRAVICRQLANRSAAGDLAALRLLLPLLAQAEAAEANAATGEAPLDPDIERSVTRALMESLAGLQASTEER
jgi:hypothetical protein